MDLITTVIPLAIVITLSPLPILPAILLLMTPRARANGWAFLVTFVASLGGLALVALFLTSMRSTAEATDEGIGWIRLITGILLLVLAVVKWVRRPRPGDPVKTPAFLAALDGYTPGKSAKLGALLGAGNPKNIAMALAAGVELAYLTEAPTEALVGLAVFVVIGSLGVAAPILFCAVVGERAAPGLQRGRAWLERNNAALSVVVLLILGVMLILAGLPAVT